MFCRSCVDVTRSRDPDRITLMERNKVYTVLLLSLLLFIYLNSRLTKGRNQPPVQVIYYPLAF